MLSELWIYRDKNPFNEIHKILTSFVAILTRFSLKINEIGFRRREVVGS